MKFRIATITVAAVLVLGAIACGSPPSNIGKGPEATTAVGGTAKTLPPTSQPTIDVPTKAAPTTKAISKEQQNAYNSALDYLAMDGGFSRKGLIEQLKYEGYPAKTATAAVDTLRVDWNGQAVITAKGYLDGQSFSRKGLTEQLEYEGFTHAQAVYGVAHSGL